MGSERTWTHWRSWLAAVMWIVAGALHAEDVGARGDGEPSSRRVDLHILVEGELHGLPTGGSEPARQSIEMDATFDFVETPAAGNPDTAATRRYGQAEATIRVDGGTQRLELPADARVIAVAKVGTTPIPYLAGAFLSRDELELLETPFDSLLIEALLPERPVSVGARWPVSGDVAAGLLAIDTVETGSLEAQLVAVTEGAAHVTVSGVVDGAVDGVPTHLVVDGSFQVAAEADEDGHMLAGDVTQLDVTINERRQPGHVAAGFDIEAKISITRRPAEDTDAVANDTRSPVDARRPGEGRPGMLWYRDAAGRYDLVHESGWRCVEDDAGGLVLRLLDLGALVAQCSITAAPAAGEIDGPSVDLVKRHVEQSLAGQFKRFDGASETIREEDHVRIVRVASEGTAEGLPFRWVHYVLTDEAGHRVNVAFMHEASLAGRFDAADVRLVAGLRFTARQPREARLPSKSEMP